MLGSLMGYGLRLPPRCRGRVCKKFQMTNFHMPNNVSSMKYALKSVPGFADVGVHHGDGDGPGTPPRCEGRVWKKFQTTNFDEPTNVSSKKYALKSIPGLTDVGVPHGDEDGPVALAPGPGSKIHLYHVDQREKLKGWHGSKATERPNWPWGPGSLDLFNVDSRIFECPENIESMDFRTFVGPLYSNSI